MVSIFLQCLVCIAKFAFIPLQKVKLHDISPTDFYAEIKYVAAPFKIKSTEY